MSEGHARPAQMGQGNVRTARQNRLHAKTAFTPAATGCAKLPDRSRGLLQVAGSAADRHDLFNAFIGPHAFQTVKFTHFRPEQVDDDIIGID